MAFEGGWPDCEVAAVAWPDSAPLTDGRWVAPGCGPAAVAGPACAGDAATSRRQSENPAGMAPRRRARRRRSRLGRSPRSDEAGAALAAACLGAGSRPEAEAGAAMSTCLSRFLIQHLL